MLVAALRGWWDEFDVSDPELISIHQSLSLVLFATRALVAAFAPLVIYFGARWVQLFRLEQSIEGYVIAGLVFWAALSIVAAFDPLFKDKTSSLKDMLSLIPGSGDRK
jgi:hypothetical protein